MLTVKKKKKGLATKVKASRSVVKTFSSIEALLLYSSYNYVFFHFGMKRNNLNIFYSNQNETFAFLNDDN